MDTAYGTTMLSMSEAANSPEHTPFAPNALLTSTTVSRNSCVASPLPVPADASDPLALALALALAMGADGRSTRYRPSAAATYTTPWPPFGLASSDDTSKSRYFGAGSSCTPPTPATLALNSPAAGSFVR